MKLNFFTVVSSERSINTVQTIHRILLVLNDDEEQKKSTTFALLEQLGKSSRLIISMAEPSSNSEDQLEMVRSNERRGKHIDRID